MQRKKRVTKELLNINDSTNIKSEIETVPEDDPVKPPSSTTTRSPVIFKGVPLSKPSPIMVETVLSDDVSEVSLLCDSVQNLSQDILICK